MPKPWYTDTRYCGKKRIYILFIYVWKVFAALAKQVILSGPLLILSSATNLCRWTPRAPGTPSPCRQGWRGPWSWCSPPEGSPERSRAGPAGTAPPARCRCGRTWRPSWIWERDGRLKETQEEKVKRWWKYTKRVFLYFKVLKQDI